MSNFKYEGKDLEAMTFAVNYHNWILAEFRAHLGKRVAEVGAGSGNFSNLLLGEPIEELVAIEPSKEMYAMLQKNVQGDPRIVSRQAFFSDLSSEYKNYFDSMVYVNVMEHIENDGQELAHAYNSLKNGGTICIFVPALSWLYSDLDASIGHYRRYHKKPLVDLLKNAGFDIVKVRYFDLIGIIPWFIVFKLMGKKIVAGNVSLYDTCVVPIAKVLESLVSPPVGKNLLIVGRKPAQS